MANSIANFYCGFMPVFSFESSLTKDEISRVGDYFYETTECHMTLTRVSGNGFCFMASNSQYREDTLKVYTGNVEKKEYLYKLTYNRSKGGKINSISKFYGKVMSQYNTNSVEEITNKLLEEIQNVLKKKDNVKENKEEEVVDLDTLMKLTGSNYGIYRCMLVDENTLHVNVDTNIQVDVRVDESNFAQDDRSYEFLKNQIGNGLNYKIGVYLEDNSYKISTVLRYLPKMILKNELKSIGKSYDDSVKYCSRILKYNGEEVVSAVAYVEGLTEDENELIDFNTRLIEQSGGKIWFTVLTGKDKKLSLLDENVANIMLYSLIGNYDLFNGIKVDAIKQEFVENGKIRKYRIFMSCADDAVDKLGCIQGYVQKLFVMLKSIYIDGIIDDRIEYEMSINGKRIK